jgi:hypothetical protein
MALLTFPLGLSEFFDLLPIGKASFEPPEQLDVAATAGGEALAADIGTVLWSGVFEMDDAMTWDEASRITPLINLLRRGNSSFMVADPGRLWPRADPFGLVLTGSAPTISALGGSGQELSLEGLPAWYGLQRSDLLSFEYLASPTRYALHEIVSDVQANASGQTPLFQVNPPLRPGAMAGTPVRLVMPHCKARLVPGESSTGSRQNTIIPGAALSWRQTLR